MKKIIVLLSAIAILTACGNNESKTKDNTSSTENKPPATDLSANPDYQKGLALVANSDCFTCHKIDEVLAAPSYKDIAKKYAGQTGLEDSLAQTIIKGVPSGTGKWGTLPMTPHLTLSEADAKAMVKYVLLLNQ